MDALDSVTEVVERTTDDTGSTVDVTSNDVNSNNTLGKWQNPLYKSKGVIRNDTTMNALRTRRSRGAAMSMTSNHTNVNALFNSDGDIVLKSSLASAVGPMFFYIYMELFNGIMVTSTDYGKLTLDRFLSVMKYLHTGGNSELTLRSDMETHAHINATTKRLFGKTMIIEMMMALLLNFGDRWRAMTGTHEKDHANCLACDLTKNWSELVISLKEYRKNPAKEYELLFPSNHGFDQKVKTAGVKYTFKSLAYMLMSIIYPLSLEIDYTNVINIVEGGANTISDSIIYTDIGRKCSSAMNILIRQSNAGTMEYAKMNEKVGVKIDSTELVSTVKKTLNIILMLSGELWKFGIKNVHLNVINNGSNECLHTVPIPLSGASLVRLNSSLTMTVPQVKGLILYPTMIVTMFHQGAPIKGITWDTLNTTLANILNIALKDTLNMTGICFERSTGSTLTILKIEDEIINTKAAYEKYQVIIDKLFTVQLKSLIKPITLAILQKFRQFLMGKDVMVNYVLKHNQTIHYTNPIEIRIPDEAPMEQVAMEAGDKYTISADEINKIILDKNLSWFEIALITAPEPDVDEKELVTEILNKE